MVHTAAGDVGNPSLMTMLELLLVRGRGQSGEMISASG